MLNDEDVMTKTGNDVIDTEVRGVIHAPAAVREGIVDALSMRGLVRALAALRNAAGTDDELERALVRVINLSGSMARAIEDGRGE